MQDNYEMFVKKMHDKHPKMFAHRYGGMAVGQGWWHILESLCANIQSHVDWKRQQRARDLVFNRKLKRAIALNSIEPLVKKDATEWQIKDAEEALVTQAFREPYARVEHVVVRQIKEKFGGLRFYYDGGDEQVYGMVRMAEAWASTICEQCGEPGKLRHGGWVQTLCDKHEAERQEEYRKRYAEEDEE